MVPCETMTTDQALEIFWNAYESYPKITGIKQSEIYKHSLEAVLSAYDKEWAERYLAMTDSMKSIQWQVKEGYLSPNPIKTET